MNFTEQGGGLHSKQCFYFSVKETLSGKTLLLKSPQALVPRHREVELELG